ncbi:hypothetical protein BIFBRE_05092 [Bifidobacterium breve DSM 20213 = JCM 1192]|uniref:Uncharacterized protein n=1 Tax=Bifidobacterium breve DSM 20213 = JCM 1192 TaxID=518634 RepID=D4BSK0_BIFBR|nr:hypothetical protein BIFBRE_05092 [Bifidobacterium breve DSM 20213 = JCM 1192]
MDLDDDDTVLPTGSNGGEVEPPPAQEPEAMKVTEPAAEPKKSTRTPLLEMTG